MSIAALLVAALLYVAASSWATVILTRAGEYSTFQKTAQLVLVWLLPIVGAALVLFMIRELHSDRARRPDRDSYTDLSPPPAHGTSVVDLHTHSDVQL